MDCPKCDKPMFRTGYKVKIVVNLDRDQDGPKDEPTVKTVVRKCACGHTEEASE